MSQLAQLQQEFAAAIFGKIGEDDVAIVQRIETGSGPDANQRIGIYRAAILGSFSRVLAETYPVIQKLLGEDFFTAMANLFARQHASVQPDLGQYGEELAGFLATFEPLKEMTYLPDVARLEWLWGKIFYAADDPLADFSVLAALDEEALQGVRFKLSASAHLFHSAYPVLDIWQANQADCSASAQSKEIDLNAGEEFLIVLRQDLEGRIDRLTRLDWDLLSAVQQQQSFQELVEIAGGAEEINQRLPIHVQRGWIVGLERL